MKRRSFTREPIELRSAKKLRRASVSFSVTCEPEEPEAQETNTSHVEEPPTPGVQEEIQVVDEGVEEVEKPVEKPLDKRIEQALRKFDGNSTTIERDLWDTIRHLAYEQSLDLSVSLVQWGRRGGIRDSRLALNSGKQGSKDKKFDPTANSFTLWPLPSEICPTPEWSLEDELTALVTTAVRKTQPHDNFDDSQVDLEPDDYLTETLVDQNQKTLFGLLNNLYEFHPPHSSSIPIYTKQKKPNRSRNQPEEPIQPAPETNEEQPDFGLDWKFVLKVADSTLQIKKSVLERAQQRLCEIYRIPLENSALDQGYEHHRTMKPLVSPTTSEKQREDRID